VTLTALPKSDGNGGDLTLATSSTAPVRFTIGGTEVVRVANGGKVGIGTSSPSTKLHVVGTIRAGSIQSAYLGDAFSSAGGWKHVTVGTTHFDGTNFVTPNIGSNAVSLFATHMDGLSFYTYPTSGATTRTDSPATFATFERVRITKDGNVGIGTTTPDHKLEVNGTIRAKEVVIEASPWPDDVFAPDYALPTVDDVAAHIAAAGHLPGVPSAATVAEQGVALGEMQKTLLRKIEELTLYVIDLKKQNAALRTRVEQLEQRN
jgi:hypothetical protein